MVKKRKRFKQATSLEERLAKFSETLHDQVKTLPGGSDQAELSRKILQTDAARRINALLNTRETVSLDDRSARF